nr:CRTAC1 family protein [Pirellulaceae bacterium]
GRAWYPGPRDFPPQPNRLYRNQGDGSFADVTDTSGIGRHAGSGMGTICFDFDQDGDTDIFVCNDQALNFLFENDGQGRFREVALEAGVACNYAGEPVGSMGADSGDYDHDGWTDLFMTDFQRQKPILFHGLGHGAFEDATLPTGTAVGSFPYVKWGCGMVDFDNDGFEDIFLGCGHLGPGLDETADRTAYQVRPILLRNLDGRRFTDVSAASGDGLQVQVVARGIGCDDLDNDGRVDLVLLSSRHDAVVLRNESPGQQHWTELRLLGRQGNRDAVGSRVRLTAGPLVQTAEVHSGRSYQSHFGSRLHFGLGPHDRLDRLEIHWHGGPVETLENLPANRLLTIAQDAGVR